MLAPSSRPSKVQAEAAIGERERTVGLVLSLALHLQLRDGQRLHGTGNILRLTRMEKKVPLMSFVRGLRLCRPVGRHPLADT